MWNRNVFIYPKQLLNIFVTSTFFLINVKAVTTDKKKPSIFLCYILCESIIYIKASLFVSPVKDNFFRIKWLYEVKRHRQNFHGFSFVLLNRILSKVTNIWIRKKKTKQTFRCISSFRRHDYIARNDFVVHQSVFQISKSKWRPLSQCPVSSQFLHDTCFSFIAAAESPDSKWYTFANDIRMHWA